MMTINRDLIDKLIEISYAAGNAILEIYNSDNFDLELKSDDSPLTKADKESNAIIANGLKSIDSTIPIISEEFEMPSYDVRKNYDTYWLIDPLDGTKEFINRNGDFTTNIALIKNGKPVAGVVYVPVSQTIYWAGLGLGAYKKLNDEEKKIQVRTFNKEDKGLIITCSRSHLNKDTEEYINQFDSPTLQKVGSSLKLMRVAEGSADIYPRLGPISEWDIAASHIIVEEAGGTVLQYPDNSEIKYNKENILMPYFVVEGKNRI